MSNPTIKLKETNVEYLLFIPYAQKERAKSIDGRHWDQKRRCWVYPRTARMYDTLIGEFGDELVSIEITRPLIPQAQGSEAELRIENQNLRDELGKIIEEKLQSFSKGRQSSIETEIQTLQLALASRENELALIQSRLQDSENEKVLIRERLEKVQSEAERLRNIDVRKGFNHQLKEILKRATGGDRDFCAFVDHLELDNSAPLETLKYLEKTLRKLLGVNDRSLKSNELISQARDAELFTEEAYHLAHLIRRHRNIVAHDNVDKRTHQARIMLVLFAAAVLWPLLPE